MDTDQEQKEQSHHHVPQIILEVNPHEELEVFYWALHHKTYPHLRKSILTYEYFRPLKESLKSVNIRSEIQEKEIIWDFLSKAHKQDEGNINSFIELSQQELDQKSQAALTGLARLMDYKWPEKFSGYRAVPVLLPFSPFGQNEFQFSILGAAQGKEQKSILEVSVHEISHMILFEILKELHPKWSENYNHNNISLFYLKEILAPVLMNQPPLRELLNLSSYPEGYLGNDDLEGIYVAEKGDNKMQITRYFQALYEQMRNEEGKSFEAIIDFMIRQVSPLESELAKKCYLWNTHSWKVFTDPEISKAYSQPIKISSPTS